MTLLRTETAIHMVYTELSTAFNIIKATFPGIDNKAFSYVDIVQKNSAVATIYYFSARIRFFGRTQWLSDVTQKAIHGMLVAFEP